VFRAQVGEREEIVVAGTRPAVEGNQGSGRPACFQVAIYLVPCLTRLMKRGVGEGDGALRDLRGAVTHWVDEGILSLKVPMQEDG